MESTLARDLFTRLIHNTKKTDSGPVSLSVEDAKSLREVAAEIVRREKEGDRERWGPRVSEMNALCKIVLTDEQLQKKGVRKAEVAQSILSAVSQAEQSDVTATQGESTPPRKRKKISPEEKKFLEQQLHQFRKKSAASASPWSRYLQPKVSDSPEQKTLSWPCPLLADRRGTFLAGSVELIRDLKKQSKEVDHWAEIDVGDRSLLTERAKELPDFFGELAQRSEPFPPSMPAEVIANAYKIMRVKELQLASAKKQLLQRASAVTPLFSVSDPDPATPTASNQRAGSSSVRSVSFAVDSPVAPAVLNSRAAETFTAITGRSVAPTNSESHLEDCCFLVAAHDKRKRDLVGSMGIRIERPVPAAALQIISKRMAPVGSLLDSASSLFPGNSSEATEQRRAVSTVLNEVFDQANVVAVERINRGSATTRQQRLADGAAMSELQRQDSMKRESVALSRIAVLARMIACGVDSLAKLQLSTETPQLAKDIMAMSGLDLTSATSAAKAVLSAAVSQKQFKKDEEKRKAQVAAIARKKALDSIQRYGGGRGRSKGRGYSRGRGKGKGRGNKRRGGRNKRSRGCHRCGSKDHFVQDCPQPPADDGKDKKS